MRTFASAFTLPSGGNWWNNSATLNTKSKWNTKLTSPGVIVDAKNEAHIQELLNGGNKLNFTGRNEMFSTLIPGNSINNSNGDMQDISSTLGQHIYKFENALHFDDTILTSFNRYKWVYGHQLEDVMDKQVVVDQDKETYEAADDDAKAAATKYAIAKTISSQHVPSLFNPNFAVDVIGIANNIPIYNNVESYKPLSSQVEQDDIADMKDSGKSVDQVQPKVIQHQVNISSFANPNFTDCSIKTLVTLSNEMSKKQTNASKELGQERFKYADFMFCKDVGRISNNYLITLRRFSHPIGDDITCRKNGTSVAPDMGRMLCYIGEDNKLEDILKYQYNTTWRPLNSKIEEQNSKEDQADRGIIGSIANLASPTYMKQVARGFAGSGNMVLNWLTGNTMLGKIMDNKGTYEDMASLGNYDPNIVYEPKDTIQETHVYEGKIKFSQEFTLTFNYEMRAYDNINPRTAFLDLLANIHVVTFRQGKFWGGARKLKGVSGNPEGWAKANAFIDKAWDTLGGFCEGLITGNIDWQSVWGSISSAFGKAGQMLSDAGKAAGDIVQGKGGQNALVRKGMAAWKRGGYSDAFKGMLKNKLGRPAMYAWHALLSGGNVGFHHVTIGNPRAPIMSIGNLIITNTTVQHYGPLGIDDFPTGLKVQVTLKHARPRDAVEIQHMYTGGKGALASAFHGIRKLERYYDFGTEVQNKSKDHKTYTATNGADSLKMVYEDGQWKLYETKNGVEQKPTNIDLNGKDPAAVFNETLTSRNKSIISYNEKHSEDEEFQPQPTWGDGSTEATHYGTIEHLNDGIVNVFGTNNVDQIVANAAVHARKA